MVIIGNIDTDGTCNNQPYYTFVQERSLGLTTDTEVYYEDAYFVRSRPQYPESPVDSVISVKDYGALGNGINDDTSAMYVMSRLFPCQQSSSFLGYFSGNQKKTDVPRKESPLTNKFIHTVLLP